MVVKTKERRRQGEKGKNKQKWKKRRTIEVKRVIEK